MKYTISIDRNKCIGDAICTALCDNWYMESDGKAMFKKEVIEGEEYTDNREAEKSCPTSVIRIRVLE
jgi:ferredoxin